MSRLAILSALALLVLASRPAFALNEKNQDRPDQPRRVNTGEDDLIRVRERMREEYRAMREERLKALKEAEEQTTGRSSAAVPGWRTGRDPDPRAASGAAAPDALPPEERTPDALMPGQAALVNVFLAVCGVGLSVLLFLRLRRGASMRRRQKNFRNSDGPMTLSLNSIEDRRFGGGSGGYTGRPGITADSRSSKKAAHRVS